jgi:hypothetical protein
VAEAEAACTEDRSRVPCRRTGAERAPIERAGTDGRTQWANIIGMLTMHPEVGRKVLRLLGEIQAGT